MSDPTAIGARLNAAAEAVRCPNGTCEHASLQHIEGACLLCDCKPKKRAKRK